MRKNKVYVTQSVSISAAGLDNNTLFQNILDSHSGIQQQKEYFQDLSPAIGLIQSNNTFYENLYLQIQEVIDKSNLENFSETILIIGSSVGGMNHTENVFLKTKNYTEIEPNLHNINAISYLIEKKFSFKDCISFSTACTSSGNAIGYAYELLSKGIYKNALVVGIDQISQTTVGGFLSLGVLSSNPCKPFDSKRDGMNVAEAIATLLLQTEVNEKSVELCGVGYSSDAHHMTHPHPDGLGAQKSMNNALKSAGLLAKDIQYINAHGTGTQANDEAEANAIASIFETNVYVSSTKSITGHTLGAASALEAVICSLILEKQIIPKSTALENQENENIMISKENRETKIKYVMSNSFAFGGNNCSIILGAVQ